MFPDGKKASLHIFQRTRGRTAFPFCQIGNPDNFFEMRMQNMRFKNMIKEPLRFAAEIVEKRGLISELAKRDYKSRYMGSVLGFVWTFAQPIMMMLIMWGVFTFGLKAGKMAGDIPFVVYFFVAQVMWNFFSDTWSSSTNVILEYSFLVKKINFRLSILPIVKMISAFINHFFLMIFVIIVLIANGYTPNLFWIQSLYYLFCMACFVLGLSWLSSSMNVFWKDIGYIINIILQFGFWMTPIFWNIKAIPESFWPLIKANPCYYLIEGYRNCFVYHKPFWADDPRLIIQFWIVTIIMLFLGMLVFRRLRPHFADVI
jgi:lipopolysaccharide transport system permease protein/teichoic acid transport system permease protein